MKKWILIPVLLLIMLIGMLLAPTPAAATVEGTDPRDPSLVYFEIRGDLDETQVVGHGTPTEVNIGAGIFTGYSLPIWSDPVNFNEELYFSVCIPDMWDGEHDIVIEVITALSNAGEKGNTYQLDLAWEKATPNVEVVPVSFHSDSAQRYNLSDLQYYCYRDFFVIDYDAPADDPIIYEDELDMRLRLGQVGGQYPDLNGELIILHFGILFPRGDLLGNPPDFSQYITEADMEEIGIQFGIFNGIITGWAAYMLIGMGLLFILGISALAFWRWNSIVFMALGGAAVIFGFAWYDAFTTTLGLALGLMMFLYGLGCFGFGFACMFWRRPKRESAE